MLAHILVYLFSFAGIWIGSGLAIKSVERLSRSLKMSSFLVSFVVLGFFTSISELSVGVNAVIHNDPEIFVGNLIGASIVLMMLIAPLLAIGSKSIRISPEFRGYNLPAALVVAAIPVVVAMDGRIGRNDAIISLALFGLLLLSLQSKRGLLDKIKGINQSQSVRIGKEMLKIVFGLAVIFVASRFVVEQTVYFSNLLGVSPFLISLMLIAVGTNIPELSLVIRSAFMRNRQVAFGNYIGSATFNTFLFGLLALLYGEPIVLTNSYLISLLFLIAGLVLFYYFARTKNTITRNEGLLMLILYLVFILTEVGMHGGFDYFR